MILFSVMVYTCELLAAYSFPRSAAWGRRAVGTCQYALHPQPQAQERRRPQPRTCAARVAHQDTVIVSAFVRNFPCAVRDKVTIQFPCRWCGVCVQTVGDVLFSRDQLLGVKSAAGTFQCALHSQPLTHARHYRVEVVVIEPASGVEIVVTELVSGVP